MSERKVDYDRGVIINNHPGSGMDVYMYVDEPGHFMNAHLHRVPDEIAREAGFNTDLLAKERLRLERKAQAGKIIDQELEDEASTEEVVVDTRNDFKLVTIGLGRYNVKDPEDNILNAHPLPETSAVKLFVAMAGEVVSSEPEGTVAKGGKNK